MADTMQMGDQACAVVYVDAGIGSPGDGSTPAAALANIPAVGSLANNTVYLIRRTLAAGITLTSGTKSSGDHVYLIGMPKPTDWLYERVPVAAKAAWDADAADYALANFSAYNTTFQLNPIDNAGFHRLKFTRPSPSSGNGPAYPGSTMMLDVRSSYSGSEYASNGMFFFTNNWWCDSGVTLSVGSWTTNTGYSSGGMCFQYARSVKFCNNHIEFNGSYNSNPYNNPLFAVCMNYVRHLIASDNDFWLSSFGSNGNNVYVFGTYSTYNGQGYIEFNRNTIHLVCQNYSYVSFFQPINLVAKDIFSHDCSMVVDRYYNRSAITSGSYLNTGFYYQNGDQIASCPGKWDIQNISVDSGDICNIATALIYLRYYIAGYRTYGTLYPSSIIKNITAKCASSGGIASSYNGWAVQMYLPPDVSPVDGITAWHYMANGLLLCCESDNGQTAYKGGVFKNCWVKGLIAVYNVSFVQITSWTLGSAPGTNKLDVGNANVYIQTATIDPGFAWGAQQWLRFYRTYGTRIIIDQIDVAPYINWNNTPAYDDCVLINNVQGVPGKWYGTNYYYTGQSWNAYRTGGANAAVKFTGNVSEAHWTHLEMALPPFRGLEWTPPATGLAKATIHLAHKNMTTPANLQKRIKALVLVPYWDAVEGQYQPYTYLGDVEGKILDDSASVWNNDSGLTQLKLEIPFTVNTAGQLVTVRFFFDWYDPTGYFYLDPLVEFAMV